MDGSGNDTLTVTGDDNQFAVVYTTASADEIAAAQAGTDPGFSPPNGGKVYTEVSGGSNLTVDGGGQQFVVDYLVPDTSGGAPAAAGATVNVGGSGNKFVVAYNTTGADSSGNAVNVASGGNQFAIAYNDPSSVSGNSVSVAGGDNQFAVAYNDSPTSGSGNAASGSTVSVDSNDSKFVVADNEPAAGGAEPSGANAVSVDGDGNQFAVTDHQPAPTNGDPASSTALTVTGSDNQYAVDNADSPSAQSSSAASDSAASDSAASGASDAGAAPAATDPTANPAPPADPTDPSAAPVPGNNTVSVSGDGNQFVVAYGASASGEPAADNSPTSGATPIDFNALLASSPFAGLLQGGDPAAIFASLASGPNPFASLMADGGNPATLFASLAANGGGNPFASLAAGGGGNPFASLFSGSGGSATAAAPASGGSAPVTAPSGDIFGALLLQSPFAPLANLVGVQGLESIFTGLAGGSGGNPFANLSGTDLSSLFSGAAGVANPFASGGAPASTASDSGSSTDSSSGAHSTGALSTDALGALLAQSPFGPLVNILGAQGVEDIFSGMGGGSAAPAAPANVDPATLLAGLNGGVAPSGTDLTSLLAQTPFGTLVNTLGPQGLDDLFGSLASDGGNPFANLGGADAASLFSGLANSSDPSAAGDAAALQGLFGSILTPATDGGPPSLDSAAAGTLSAIGAAMQQASTAMLAANPLQTPAPSPV